MISTMLALLLSGSLGPAIQPTQPVTVVVDCDAGQNLARYLKMVEKAPGSRLQIRGTCVGNFVLTTDRVRLDGAFPGGSTLVGADPTRPVLQIRDAVDVVVARMTIREGAVGIEFDRSRGNVAECTFEQNGGGISYRDGAEGTIQDSTFDQNAYGVSVGFRSSTNIQRSTFEDHSQSAISVFSYSTAVVSDSEVRGSARGGVEVRNVSSVSLFDSTFAENDVHAYAADRSRIDLTRNVALGSAGDSTVEAVGLDDDSSLHTGLGVDIFGTIRAWGASYVELGDVNVQGTIRSEHFSRVYLYATQTNVPAVCASGGDLVCTGSSAIVSTGCASATSCNTPPAPTLESDRPDAAEATRSRRSLRSNLPE